MCSIFGSNNIDSINQLKQINEYRGTLNHSIALFDRSGALISLVQKTGAMKDITQNLPQSAYAICHQQAPTTQEQLSLHPSIVGSHVLWHNGIVKAKYLHELQEINQDSNQWDTYQINLALHRTNSFDCLTPILGSFSCILYREDLKKLFMFRNEISPMFILEDKISSTKFENSQSIDSNTIYEFDFENQTWIKTTTKFDNVETPFFFID